MGCRRHGRRRSLESPTMASGRVEWRGSEHASFKGGLHGEKWKWEPLGFADSKTKKNMG